MSTLVGAVVPGLPHVLKKEKSPAWARLHDAYLALGKKVEAEKPDVLIVHSTQWLSVLGISFQCQAHPVGTHVDDNWYDLGDLPFDFKVDSALSSQLALSVAQAGFPTKTVDYEAFPIDTGTIVAMDFLNAKSSIPVCPVSSWVYADAGKSFAIGQAMAQAVKASGKRALFLAVTLLSAGYDTTEIDPALDKVSSPNEDRTNQLLLETLASGQFEKVAAILKSPGTPFRPDMLGNAFHWLAGALSGTPVRGEVLAYGPQWGCGAGIVSLHA